MSVVVVIGQNEMGNVSLFTNGMGIVLELEKLLRI